MTTNIPATGTAVDPRQNVAGSERAVSAISGALVALYGLAKRNGATPFFLLLGGVLISRGVTGRCRIYDRLGLDTNRAKSKAGVSGSKGIRVEKSIIVGLAPAQVFGYWRNLENLPIFMPHIRSVKCGEDGISHWKVEGPASISLEWDAEIINEHPGELLAWQSLPGAQVQNAGTVRFAPAKNGQGTVVTVVLQYQPPGGRLGAAVAGVFGEAPEKQLEADLVRFRDWVEAEPVIVGA